MAEKGPPPNRAHEPRKLSRAGHKAEIAWPAGAYQVGGWTFPTVETDEGAWIGQYVLQLEPWTTGREPE